jgi:hypothetical protein
LDRESRAKGRAGRINVKFYSSLAFAAMLLTGTAIAHAQSLPAYMAPISGVTTTTPGDIATKDMLALNTGMFELYGDAGKFFRPISWPSIP